MKKLFYASLLVTLLSSCDNLHNIEQEEYYDYAFIDMNDYPDWQEGVITKDDLFMLVREDISADEIVTYVNMINSDDKGVVMYFDMNMELKAFVTEQFVCNVHWTGYENADIQIITKSGESTYMSGVYIPYVQKEETRAFPLVAVLGGAVRGLMAILTIEDAVSLTNNVLSNDFKEAGWDLVQLLTGGVVRKARLAVQLRTDLTTEALDALRKKLQEEPSITIANLSIGITESIDDGNWDRRINYTITLKIKGGLLMTGVYPYYVGNWTRPTDPAIAIYWYNRPMPQWVNYSSKSKPHTAYIYYSAMTNEGEEVKSSNYLVFDFNGNVCNISLSSSPNVIYSVNSSQVSSVDTALASPVLFEERPLTYN